MLVSFTLLPDFTHYILGCVDPKAGLEVRKKKKKSSSLSLGFFLHGVQGKVIDDVSETAVDPIFTGHE